MLKKNFHFNKKKWIKILSIQKKVVPLLLQMRSNTDVKLKTYRVMRNEILKLQKGQFVAVTTMYPTSKVDEDLYKKIGGMPNPFMGRITKRTEHSGIHVCEYENMAQVIAEREQGKEPKAPWYEWLEFPYIVRGKKNGNDYFIVKTTQNYHAKVTYYLDGVEVDYSEIAHAFKAKSRGELPRVLTFQLEYIERIKQKDITYTK